MKSRRHSAIRIERPALVRRRRLNFGPGTALALIVVAGILYARRDEFARHGARRLAEGSPRIDRNSDQRAFRIIRNTGAPGAGVVPEVSTLLTRRDELKLSAQQVKAIEALQSEGRSVSTPLREEAERAGNEFRVWMQEAEKRGRVTVDQLQQHSATLRAASAQLAEQRRDSWERALKVLTKEQQAQIQPDPGGKK
jgi:hypothetical protein